MSYLLRYTVIVLLTAGWASATHAVELKKTPVQDAMFARLAGDEWKEDKPKTDVVPDEALEQEGQPQRKSVAKAAILSALIPGAGQYYVGSRSKAKYFFAVEAVTWIAFFSFRTYGSWKKDDMINYGNLHANAQLDGKDDEFLDMVGFYDNIYQYNSFGRVFDPERPYLYDTPENHWLWQTDKEQAAFRELKNASREAYRRSEFMIGVAVVSRLVSIADAIRDGIRHNRRVESEFGRTDKMKFRLAIDPLSPDRQLTLTLYPPL